MEFSPGSQVTHRYFGSGTVLGLEGSVLTIDFGVDGVHKIIKNHASLNWSGGPFTAPKIGTLVRYSDLGEGHVIECCVNGDLVVDFDSVGPRHLIRERNGYVDAGPALASAPIKSRYSPAIKDVARIEATQFVWTEPRKLPRREWLYGRHLIRGFMSATIAAGGVGKSSLLIAETLAMVTGRDLLGSLPAGRLGVWTWNGEDPRDELERRFAGAMLHYGIDRSEVEGALYINSGRTTPIVIAEETRDGTKIMAPVVTALVDEIRCKSLDVVIIDPFVASHRVSENDNRRIEEVARTWTEIADATGCAIELVHHARKTGGAEVTVEDGRGAVALIAKARSVRVLNRMSREEAGQIGVSDDVAVSLIRVDIGKANLAPPATQATWRQLVSVGLGNGINGDPESQDWVGVVTRWARPDPLEGVTLKHLIAVQRAIDGKSYRENIQAKDWIGYPIAEVLEIDDPKAGGKAKINAALKMWLRSGALVVSTAIDKKGKNRPIIEVGEWADD